MSYFSIIKLRNILWSIINPATEDKQDTANTHLSNINTKQSDWLQKTQISNWTIEASIRQVSTQVVSTDKGIVTNAVIHWQTTAWGGSYVDVKVAPSWAIQVWWTLDWVTGMATEAKQDTQITSLWTDWISPPSISWTWIRWWLRAIYEKLVAWISILWTVTITEWDTLHNDAFWRDRVSETWIRFDSEFIYSKRPDLFDEVNVTGASATHNSWTRDVTLSIANTTTGSSCTLSSHYDIPYTAGSSQLIDITWTLDNANIWWWTAYIFLRSSTSWSVVETTYAQNTWNTDTVNSVDWSKSQIFMMDFQSLKVWRIRFSLVRSGIPVKVHEIVNDNIRAWGYWQSPSLPVYWRIYNDATYTYSEIWYWDENNGIWFRYRITKNASATCRAICCTVKSEWWNDLKDITGMPRSADNWATSVTVSTTIIPVLSIRMASTFNSITNRTIAIIEELEVSTDNPIQWIVLYKPTLTWPSWTAVDATNSALEYDVTASAVSWGVKIASWYVTTSAARPASSSAWLLGKAIMSLWRTGTSDIVSLCAVRTWTNNAKILSAINWKEIR